MPGLNSINNLLFAVESVEDAMVKSTFIKNTVSDKKEDIVKMNVSQLNDKGENSLGVRIDSFAPYTPYTILLKESKGQPTNRVTLRDTGAFHSSFDVSIESVGFRIIATDSKTEMLVDKYGGSIFGLNERNILITSHELLYPGVMRQIKEKIYGRS